MLTHNDHTVSNAWEIFEQCKDSKARYFGFKEDGIPLCQMKELFTYMKACGKKTFLEVVAYTEKECLEGAKMAVECGCDVLMGTTFSDSVNTMCRENKLKYMPFVGRVKERPSVLEETAGEMLKEAEGYLEKGVYFGSRSIRYVNISKLSAGIRSDRKNTGGKYVSYTISI